MCFQQGAGKQVEGLVVSMTDDTICAGSRNFADWETKAVNERFASQGDEGDVVTFASNKIVRSDEGHIFGQEDHIAGLKPVHADEGQLAFRSMRGKTAFLASSTRPDVAFRLAKLAQVPRYKAT
eukprot:Plantae.Rhodophyta-Rhodochaete_pulchella.ctg84563.p1 GENE.Plantae.Rhodophyta-Rhodochaete_pulchella.ctg84563~~Plantae.Rhodophyta-Rhodochaete_pulchella.ctg84563.p1  ORF type:complete len:124 (+),score=17.54 Plantae.Rhodophyta-Rhodochaete_pulchella.ctg84563:133-504(+)